MKGRGLFKTYAANPFFFSVLTGFLCCLVSVLALLHLLLAPPFAAQKRLVRGPQVMQQKKHSTKCILEKITCTTVPKPLNCLLGSPLLITLIQRVLVRGKQT